MARAFYYEYEEVSVALAPWCSNCKQQRHVSGRVSVAEQKTPNFALRFDLELFTESGRKHLMRLVNQRQMLRVFQFAFVGLEAEKRRAPGLDEAGEELDRQVKKWLGGEGRVQAPPKEELARWLLAWMIVTPAEDDEWLVLICGEPGVEEMDDLAFDDAGDYAVPVSDDKEERSCTDSEEDTEEDSPPPYEYVEADKELSEEEFNDREVEERRPARTTEGLRMKLARRTSLTGSNRSFQSIAKDKLELKLTTVSLNPRPDGLYLTNVEDETSSDWSKDRRHYHDELRASRRRLQVTKQQCEKVERLAQVRHTAFLKESARKLRLNDQQRRDAIAARQLRADTREYREELQAMETRAKQAFITAHRDQERVRRQTRVVTGNTGKPLLGTVKLMSGPLSKKELELLYGGPRDESAVYDLHGRRHNLQDAEQIATESAFKSAMGKVRRLLLHTGNTIESFRRHDLDRNGSLSYAEFQRLLRENGTELTKEQSEALFKSFDADESGQVDYVELLWGFFDCEAFLKRWHGRKSANTTARTEREIFQLFQRFERNGQGVLPLLKFQLVMDQLGVTLSDTDAQLLAIKFDAGIDGYIDYFQFLDFVKLSTRKNVPPDDLKADDKSAVLGRDNSCNGMKHIWKELQSLSATQEKLHRLFR